MLQREPEMRLTPEKLVELKTMAEHARSHFCIELAEAFVRSVPALTADLEEAQRRISISEAFAKELSSELITARKKLAESERRYSESVGGFKRDLQQKLDDQRSKSVRLKAKLAEAQSRDGSIAPVAAIKFSLKTDCGDQFLRCWVEGSFDAIRSEWPEAPEAVFIGADPLHPNTQQTGTAALDAAIAEAIEPYRKDAACWQFARKELCWSRSGDKEAKWVMYIEMDAPTITAGQLRDDSVAESLDAAVLAAIAAKGESECPS
jgi:hypothetical protein